MKSTARLLLWILLMTIGIGVGLWYGQSLRERRNAKNQPELVKESPLTLPTVELPTPEPPAGWWMADIPPTNKKWDEKIVLEVQNHVNKLLVYVLNFFSVPGIEPMFAHEDLEFGVWRLDENDKVAFAPTGLGFGAPKGARGTVKVGFAGKNATNAKEPGSGRGARTYNDVRAMLIPGTDGNIEMEACQVIHEMMHLTDSVHGPAGEVKTYRRMWPVMDKATDGAYMTLVNAYAKKAKISNNGALELGIEKSDVAGLFLGMSQEQQDALAFDVIMAVTLKVLDREIEDAEARQSAAEAVYRQYFNTNQ